MIRRDEELTAAMYATGVFQDKKKRSYIANWLHPGTAHRCEYLFGEDKRAQRPKIYERAEGFCQGCPTAHWIGWEDGEWHHVKGGHGRQHCDCPENGLWVCGDFHRKQHVAVRWTRREAILEGERRPCNQLQR